MSKTFAFSALFSAVGVAAAFDDAIAKDAAAGRVNHAFAKLAVAEYGLPLLKADGNAIGKPAMVKLADQYRAVKGKGTVRGHVLQATWGAALDAIALGLQAGADDGSTAYGERVAALRDAGKYLTPDAWAEMTKPAPKAAKAAKAPAVAAVAATPAATPETALTAEESAEVAAMVGALGADSAEALGADSAEALGAESAGGALGVTVETETVETEAIGADALADAVILGLQTGAFTLGEAQAILQAAQDAIAALTAETAGIVASLAGNEAHALTH